MEAIYQPPEPSSFRPLADFQSQTPSSFHGGPPILHLTSSGLSLLVSVEDLSVSVMLSKILGNDFTPESTQNGYYNHDDPHERAISGIDIWVTSEKLILFNRSETVGLVIPYPDISVHALQRRKDPATTEEVQSIYLQITKSDSFDDHDPDETVSLTLIPSSRGQTHETSQLPSGEGDFGVSGAETSSPASELFSAISACSSLHPGPASPSSSLEDGAVHQRPETDDTTDPETLSPDGLPPALPGSGGWITAENMDQFFDEAGNWRGGGLGPGAGTTRAREQDDINGHAATEEPGEETKWLRTG